MNKKILDIMAGFAAPCEYGITASDASLAAKEIIAHIKEFIEWIIYLGIGDEDALLFHFVSVKEAGHEYAHTEQLFFKDIEEAYQYWLNNVKNE